MDHYRFWLYFIQIHINNILTSHNVSIHSLLNVFDSLCRTIMLTKQVYYLLHLFWNLSIQQIHCCLSLNMNRIDKNINRKINIILYGGSLGSLFDEERSKVRESNANCRTHWAWITRTHLAAKTLVEAKFASVLFI